MMLDTPVVSKRLGRPSLFEEGFNDLVYRLALLGLNDTELSNALDIGRDTLDEWRRKKPEFRAALEEGKDIADANVARSWYMRAVGYSVADEKIFYNKETGEVVKVPFMRHIPPDSSACQGWLRNRRRDYWSVGAPEEGAQDQPTIIFNPVTVRVQQVEQKNPPTIDVE